MGRTKKKQTREEKLEKKRLAEKRRLEKIRSDPQRYEEFKAKDRARYYKKKEQKKVLPINEMTPRRQRIQRKRNRDNFRAHYTRQKNKKKIETFLRQESPPDSDNDLPYNEPPLQQDLELPPQPDLKLPSQPDDDISLQPDHALSPQPDHEIQLQPVPESSRPLTRRNYVNQPASPCPSRSSTSSTVSKSTFRKYQYKNTKIIKNLQRKVIELQKEKNKLRKQAERLKNIVTDPRNIKTTKAEKKSTEEKRYLNKKGVKCVNQAQSVKLDVQNFLTDDENSRICPGKKDYVSKNKTKHQKRYLTDTLQNLHQKFLSCHQYKIHYGTFCRLRPFWVLIPSVTTRDTCVCKIHDNMALIIASLKYNKIITENNSTEVLINLTCDRYNINCLQRKCVNCRNRVIIYKEFNNSEIITYNSWEKKKQTFTKRGVEKKTVVIEKVKISSSPLDVIKKFEQDLKAFMSHCAYIINQSHALKNSKENLKNEECVLHIDYSENYNCKLGTEIQSMHFGGSRKQITLHTAVLYYCDKNTGEKKTKSICTLSKCLRHDASAVWAHVVPLLKYIEDNCPHVRLIHIFSDSPSSQYRNRKIFYMISKLSWYLPKLQSVTWNYSECGHGKGAPDGVGGVLKRSADKHVAHGNDITDLDDFVQFLKEKKVSGVLIEVVDEYNVLEKDMLFPQKLPMFSGTMKVHQAVWNSHSRNSVTLRTMTCVHEDCFSKAIACIHDKHLGFYKIEDPQSQSQARIQDNPKKKIKILSQVVFNPYPLQNQNTQLSLNNDDQNPKACTNENFSQESFNEKENMPVQLGSWVLVELKTFMGVKQFVASVVDVRFCDYYVIFLDHIDGLLYSWPDNSDTDIITVKSIVRVLNEPIVQSDGKMYFKD